MFESFEKMNTIDPILEDQKKERELYQALFESIRKNGAGNPESQQKIGEWCSFWEHRVETYEQSGKSRVWAYLYDLQRSSLYVTARDKEGFLDHIQGTFYQLENEPDDQIRERLMKKAEEIYDKAMIFFQKQ